MVWDRSPRVEVRFHPPRILSSARLGAAAPPRSSGGTGRTWEKLAAKGQRSETRGETGVIKGKQMFEPNVSTFAKSFLFSGGVVWTWRSENSTKLHVKKNNPNQNRR